MTDLEFERDVEGYRAYMESAAVKHKVPLDDAIDIVSDVVISLWKKRRTVDPERIQQYRTRALFNRIRDYVRTERRTPLMVDINAEIPTSLYPCTYEEVIKGSYSVPFGSVDGMIPESMSAPDRKILSLVATGCTGEEIAEGMGCSIDNQKWKLFHARRRARIVQYEEERELAGVG